LAFEVMLPFLPTLLPTVSLPSALFTECSSLTVFPASGDGCHHREEKTSHDVCRDCFRHHLPWFLLHPSCIPDNL
jgi:hypothetical protein